MNRSIDFLIQHYDIRSPDGYNYLFHFVENAFLNDPREQGKVRKIAHKIKTGLIKIDPFVQASTALVCPSCKNVCCINKHGYYNFEDLIYMFALQENLPLPLFGCKDTDSCQFLSENGCTIQRQFRPSGCNWYFCDSLLVHMEAFPKYQDFDDDIGEIACLWLNMVEEFSRIIQVNHK